MTDSLSTSYEVEVEEKINLIALGNQEVGKTSFILRYINNSFRKVYLSTMGIDMQIKNITLPENKILKIFFYDTAGEERFKSISFNVLKYSDGIVLMYDITNKKSFDSISGWMESIKESKGDNFPVVLVGNKSDLNEKREVTKEEGKKLANNYKIYFFETSNKIGTNVEECCSKLINKILEKKDKLRKSDTKSYRLSRSVHIKKKKKNCQC